MMRSERAKGLLRQREKRKMWVLGIRVERDGEKWRSGGKRMSRSKRKGRGREK